MANINRTWKRVMAVSCSHGEALDKQVADDVLAFSREFKPDAKFHLGDVIDATAFRSGAAGTPDESADVGVDQQAGIDFLLKYEPTHITWGNHDIRLLKLAQHRNAMISYCATQCWNKLQEVADQLGAQTRPYHIRKGWFELGGYHWGHGYMFNVNALRDHAETIGGPCVIGHIHTPSMWEGRTLKWSPSYCVGMIGDPEHEIFNYAKLRRQYLSWGGGAVFGEYTDNESVLWLAKSERGQRLHFPL